MLFERLVTALEAIAKALAEGKSIPGVIPGAAAAAPAPAAAAPADAKPTTRGSGGKKQETAAPAAATTAAPAAPAAATPPPAVNTIPYDRLKKAVIDLAQVPNGGRAAAVALLDSYGVKKADAAPPEKWPEMFEKAVAEMTRLTSDTGGDFA
jgi:hypothetical protein